jgi:3D-(3,5/4)-trihydroxycyclohexane-1,2-dione acylhydrolase (decyclizing)
LLVAGGGVLYALGSGALRTFAERHGVPVAETQAGKGALPWDHPLQVGAIGVTGSPAANALAAEADVVLAVGTRLSDFTTGSHSLFAQAQLVNLTWRLRRAKWRGVELVADAARANALSAACARRSEPDGRLRATPPTTGGSTSHITGSARSNCRRRRPAHARAPRPP